ncbi:MAG: site-specific DNA-methyltransferase, partial [Gemmatimonadetes bacterium]|nr:site-specific DNA-methyltransferase [Gemmatimonadota bacterium]
MTEFSFKGKEILYSHHLAVPCKELKADGAKSLADKPSLDDNLIVHGDNLAALRALLPFYAGRVNCIYIDPPYNTGNEGWCYNDNVSHPALKEWLGKEVGTDDMERHDKWCAMMWPRLHLLKDLLAEDGVIFISIDDNEQHRLRMLMDEIFGEGNFIANIIWQKKYAPSNDAKYFSDNHDFVLCYAKNRGNGNVAMGASWKRRLLPRTEKQDRLYRYNDKDGRGPWRMDNLSVKSYSSEYDYPIVNPNTGEAYNPPQGGCWRTSKENLQNWIKENRVFFGPDGKGAPQLKRYLREVQQGLVPLTVWLHEEVGHTDGARKSIKEIFSDKASPFENPKSLNLLKQIFTIAGDKDAIILDSFAGSGTTAQAVLALNKEDGGNRKFILVECEDYADKITAERVRRVIKGVPQARDAALQSGLGGSFTWCTLGADISAHNLLKGKKYPDWDALARHVFFLGTGEQLPKTPTKNAHGFVGKSSRDGRCVYLLYEPSDDF